MKKKVNKEAVKAAEIVAALGSVTKDKSISMDLVLETIKDALTTAAKKYLATPYDVVEVKVDRDKGTIEVYKCQVVAEIVEDPEYQISLEEARQEDADLVIGDKVVVDTLPISEFGRTAVMTAKQVIVQRVREAERDRIFSDYSERVGEIVTGKVQQVERGNILVDIGRTEAILPLREQIRKERYAQGANIRACIKEVKSNTKGPQVIISRTCEEFLERLFESEVPEISDKTVKIVKVVRDPGHRSKIAVTTSDSRVDPVGACVGMRGNRVQNIVRELSNERIDIINWTDELSLLVRRVFAPAEVKRVIPVGDHKIVVVIGEEGLALAIGREGQNIRLASKMLGREIDVFGDDEFAGLSDDQRAAALAEKPDTIPTGELKMPGGDTAAESADINAEDGDEMLDAGLTVTLEAIRKEVIAESVGEDESEGDDDSVHKEILSDAVGSLSTTDDDSETAIENANKSEV
ncbi:MAG: transcription termination factor NusA [Chitinispirillia bacterium]|nr:transcription termination factor NusA [Chitinispirillia bacterium]MCL2242115.1 transcription termination factor NusA [Chitinispirillia bacterium]